MADCMSFPETPLEFLKLCEFKDEKEIYTNGSMLIPTFRVEQMIEHYFNSTSTADVQEVRHGKNVTTMNSVDEFECSECGFVCEIWENIYDDEYTLDCQREYNPKFCPNCGAKMDKE